jgi:hypothetical protein
VVRRGRTGEDKLHRGRRTGRNAARGNDNSPTIENSVFIMTSPLAYAHFFHP